MTKISVFGNENLDQDSIPIKILPKLREIFPEFSFIIEDPNELNAPETGNWVIIDTVFGIKTPILLSMSDVEKLSGKRISVHDYDLSAHLIWIKKINKNTDIKIIGVPPNMTQLKAVTGVSKILSSLL